MKRIILLLLPVLILCTVKAQDIKTVASSLDKAREKFRPILPNTIGNSDAD